jgi:hypothetical protein
MTEIVGMFAKQNGAQFWRNFYTELHPKTLLALNLLMYVGTNLQTATSITSANVRGNKDPGDYDTYPVTKRDGLTAFMPR